MGRVALEEDAFAPAARVPDAVTQSPSNRVRLPAFDASVLPLESVPLLAEQPKAETSIAPASAESLGVSTLPEIPAEVPAIATSFGVPDAPRESASGKVELPPVTLADPPSDPVQPRPIENKPIRNGTPAAEKASEDGGERDSSAGKAGGFASGLRNLGQVAAALAIVIGLIFVGKAVARKFVPGAGTSAGRGVIEILARHPLSKNQSIVLVRIGSQIVALNQGREASESVLVISDAGEVARIIGQIEGKNPDSVSAGFNRLLANARMDLERDAGESELHQTSPESLDAQLDEMAAAKRQLMELRQHVRSVRDSIPRT